MKSRPTLVLLALLMALGYHGLAVPLDTAFNYSGKLQQSGSPANGNYDLAFTLFDASASGAPIAGPVTNSGVAVSNGVFSVTLDFGLNAFNGDARWLEIKVRTNGVGSFTTLSPRQLVRAIPYALYAMSTHLAGSYPNALILTNPENTFAGSGAGLANLNASAIDSGTINDARLSTNVAFLNHETNRFSGKVIVDNALIVTSNLVCKGNVRADGDASQGSGRVIATGNITSGSNIIAAANIAAGSNISAMTFTGDGSGLTNLALGLHMDIFTSNSVFVVPEGVTRLLIEVWGAGGGGGNGHHPTAPEDVPIGGGGGGGGGYARGTFQVVPGTSYIITRGEGGDPGQDGGTTSFGSLIWVTGGKAGEHGSAYTPTHLPQGGAGGIGSALISLKGRRGRSASEMSSNPAAGGGDGGDGALGGAGGIGEDAKDDGDAPRGDAPGGGGAGGGIGDTSPGGFSWGGRGGGGFILVHYVKSGP